MPLYLIAFKTGLALQDPKTTGRSYQRARVTTILIYSQLTYSRLGILESLINFLLTRNINCK